MKSPPPVFKQLFWERSLKEPKLHKDDLKNFIRGFTQARR